MTIDEIKAMSDGELSAVVARLWYPAWDETRCRICGWPVETNSPDTRSVSHIGPCTRRKCTMHPSPTQRADSVSPYASDPHAALDLLFRVQAERDYLIDVHLDAEGAICEIKKIVVDVQSDHAGATVPVWVKAIVLHTNEDRQRTTARAVAEAAAMIERGEA